MDKLISVVVPVFNEGSVVAELHRRILHVLAPLRRPFEVIFVDDGSTDGTFANLKTLSPVRIFRLRKNFGQSQALHVGVENAKGNVIVTLDGDLENFPEDIPLLIEKLEEGRDVVCGWRKDRWGKNIISRRLPSIIANKLISLISGVPLHDHGCTLKAWKTATIRRLEFKGEEHRLIAAWAAIDGANVAEVPVRYTPRTHGKSKYGIMRTFKVSLDSLALLFFKKYSERPMHFFGSIGFISFAAGIASFIAMVYLKYWRHTTFIQTPLPVLTALFTIVGIQFILMGLLAEILIRTLQPPKEKRLDSYVAEEVEKS